MTVHRDKFLIIEPTRCINFSKLLSWNEIYMFLDSFYVRITMDPVTARKLSVNLYDIYHCCVYSGKLLMMDRGTIRNV